MTDSCPRCEGTGVVLMPVRLVLVPERRVEWQQEVCPVCEGKKTVITIALINEWMHMLQETADIEKDMAAAQALGAMRDDLLRYDRVVTTLAMAFPFSTQEVRKVSCTLMLSRMRLGLWWLPTADEEIDLWAAVMLGALVPGAEFLEWLPGWMEAARALWQR